jgi:hypothetical protein
MAAVVEFITPHSTDRPHQCSASAPSPRPPEQRVWLGQQPRSMLNFYRGPLAAQRSL